MSMTLLALKAMSKMQIYIIIGLVSFAVFVLLIALFELAYKSRVKRYNKKLARQNKEASALQEELQSNLLREAAKQDAATYEDYMESESVYDNTEFVHTEFDRTEVDYTEPEPQSVKTTKKAKTHKPVEEPEPIVHATPNDTAIENEALKLKVAGLQNEVEELKSELARQDQSTRGIRVTGYNADIRELEEELLRTREQYDVMGEQLEKTTDENEKLDIYIKRITLLEKIMQIGSGIERLKNTSYEYEARSQYNGRSNNRAVYSKLMEQVRRLNDRIDNMEKSRAARNNGDYYSDNYNKR